MRSRFEEAMLASAAATQPPGPQQNTHAPAQTGATPTAVPETWTGRPDELAALVGLYAIAGLLHLRTQLIRRHPQVHQQLLCPFQIHDLVNLEKAAH